MSDTKVLSIEEAMNITQEIPEIFAQLLDLYDAEVEHVELGVEGDQIVIRPVDKSNPTVGSVHVPSTEWNTEDKILTKSIDEEQRYTLAPWYVPDSVDAHGEWTDKAEVQRAFWDYLQKPDRSIRLQHNTDIVAGNWVEGLTWPHEVEVPIKHPEGEKVIKFPAGTPFLGVIWEPWAWELIKSGDIRGLSIGGRGKRLDVDINDDEYEYDPMGKVSFTKMIRTVGGKYVVYSEDGTKRFGTYETKEEAEERLRQIEYFGKADFKVGDFVSWNSSGGTARGRIERIEVDGTINVPDSSFSITGTTDEPAALISVWRQDKDGWSMTERLVGHKLDTLSPHEKLAKEETFSVPEGVRANAQRALQWIKDGHAGSGFTDVGRRRASQLAGGQPVSLTTIRRIYSYLSRHQSDDKAEGFERGEKGYPSAGRVAWDAWGGDAAISWARSISERFEKHLQGQHDQKFHGRGGYAAVAERRGSMMKGDKPVLRTDADGRIVNENATGGYKAGIPESVEIAGFEAPLTPKDSLWHHLESDGEGGYRITQERAKLHEKIIKQTVGDVPTSKDPTFHMLGGGPATGKSTFVKHSNGLIPDKSKAVHVNADDMKGELPEFERMRMSYEDADFFNAASFSHEESSYLAEVSRKAAIAKGADIVLDGTGNGNFDKLTNKVAEARGFGYKVKATYLTVDTDRAVERAFNRSLKVSERRYVPESVVRGTHAKVSQTYPKAITAGLFDSTSLYFSESRGNPLLLAQSNGKNLTIIDEEGYSSFLAKAGE